MNTKFANKDFIFSKERIERFVLLVLLVKTTCDTYVWIRRSYFRKDIM